MHQNQKMQINNGHNRPAMHSNNMNSDYPSYNSAGYSMNNINSMVNNSNQRLPGLYYQSHNPNIVKIKKPTDQAVIEELAKRAGGNYRQSIHAGASDFLGALGRELAATILESAGEFAKCRGSNEISVDDIQFALCKEICSILSFLFSFLKWVSHFCLLLPLGKDFHHNRTQNPFKPCHREILRQTPSSSMALTNNPQPITSHQQLNSSNSNHKGDMNNSSFTTLVGMGDDVAGFKRKSRS